MTDMRVITNNQPRFTIDWFDLTDVEKAEFDYCDEQDTFIRYRGETIPLCDFMRAPTDFSPWQGYRADSYFSAVVNRFDHEDCETVICGLALS